MKKSKGSRRWLADHESDEYVKLARSQGYRSRAVYKLQELDEKYRLLKPGSTIVDLGAAPGGWSQLAAKTLGLSGLIVALDVLPMEPIDHVQFIQGDFTEESILADLMDVLNGRAVDLVISDMAPNLSGMTDIDQPKSIYLVELALELAKNVLKPGGGFVAKCFEGSGIEDIRKDIRGSFRRINNVKPRASRGKSREIYLLGREFGR